MSRSAARSGPVTRVSGSHALIGCPPRGSEGRGLVAHHARAGGGVVGDADDAIQPVADLFDVRNEYDLRESVAQAAQHRDDALAPRLAERAEAFAAHAQRDRLA